MSAIAGAIDQMEMPDAVRRGLSQVAAAALGVAVGGGAGAAAGLNVEANNRQLHPDERKWAKDNANAFAQYYKEQTGQNISVDQAQNMLLGDGYRMVDAAANKGPGVAGTRDDALAVSFISQNAGNLFKASAAEYNNPGQLGGPLTPEQLALPGAAGNPALGLGAAALMSGGLALTGGGAAALIAGGMDAYSAYKAATAAYSLGAALGTGMAIGGASYTGSAIYAGMRSDHDFYAGFNQHFSYPGLAAATTIGGLAGMYGTAMFGWAGVPNSIKNVATLPGFIIRVNSGVAAKAAGSAAQGAVKSSSNQ